MTELEVLKDCVEVIGLEILASLKKHKVPKLSFDEFVAVVSLLEPERIEKMSKLLDEIENLEAKRPGSEDSTPQEPIGEAPRYKGD